MATQQGYEQGYSQNQNYDPNQNYNPNASYAYDANQQYGYGDQPAQQTTGQSMFVAPSQTVPTVSPTSSSSSKRKQQQQKTDDRNVVEVESKPGFDGSIFKTVRGILRPVEIIFALIGWVPVITVSGYDLFDSFQYLCAMMILVWIYSICITLVYVFRWLFNKLSCAEYLPIFEFVGDGLSMAASFTAGCIAAWRCQQELGNGVTTRTCANENGWGAGAAFALLTSFCFMASTFFSFRENKTMEGGR